MSLAGLGYLIHPSSPRRAFHRGCRRLLLLLFQVCRSRDAPAAGPRRLPRGYGLCEPPNDQGRGRATVEYGGGAWQGAQSAPAQNSTTTDKVSAAAAASSAASAAAATTSPSSRWLCSEDFEIMLNFFFGGGFTTNTRRKKKRTASGSIHLPSRTTSHLVAVAGRSGERLRRHLDHLPVPVAPAVRRGGPMLHVVPQGARRLHPLQEPV